MPVDLWGWGCDAECVVGVARGDDAGTSSAGAVPLKSAHMMGPKTTSTMNSGIYQHNQNTDDNGSDSKTSREWLTAAPVVDLMKVMLTVMAAMTAKCCVSLSGPWHGGGVERGRHDSFCWGWSQGEPPEERSGEAQN